MKYIVGDIDNYGTDPDRLTLVIPAAMFQLICDDLGKKFNTQDPYLSITLVVTTEDKLKQVSSILPK